MNLFNIMRLWGALLDELCNRLARSPRLQIPVFLNWTTPYSKLHSHSLVLRVRA